MSRFTLVRTYAFGAVGALAANGMLALLERNPQATATLFVSGVLMLVALAHASAVSRAPAGALSFMHHLSGAALAVAVAATAFAAAYLLNKDTETSNLLAMSIALVHLAISITMLFTHVAGAYADLRQLQSGASAQAGSTPAVQGPEANAPRDRRPLAADLAAAARNALPSR